MTTMITELYEALKQAGADDDAAKKAAQAVIAVEAVSRLATKADLAELKAEIQAMINRLLLTLTGIIIGSMAAMTAIGIRALGS